MVINFIKNFHIWGPSFIVSEIRRILDYRDAKSDMHIIFCIGDHFEPKWKNADPDTEKKRVERWVEKYPTLASVHRDSNGRPVQHTWFYAVEEYNPQCVDSLNKLCSQGYGEIELHLHHGNDTPEGLRLKLAKAKTEFSRHGVFKTRDVTPRDAFGFIHGNWALNNARQGVHLCGVDNELKILRDAGCYADFSLPSAPHESQTRQINSIYYARDIPGKRKSHDKGIAVEVRGEENGDLMLIQGPLALNWKRRKFGLFPGIENGCIQQSSPGTPDRIDLWVRQHIHVQGRPEWFFIKLYCHGTQEVDEDSLLGAGAHRMFSYLEKKYNDGDHYMLHYVTAREMYNIVKAAEEGHTGSPFLYKDHIIKPYLNMR